MEISKLHISQIQIDNAIGHFFNDNNYVCAITLAGAAEEILGNILRETGYENILSEIHNEAEDGKFSKFSAKANEIRNELKHSHNNPDLQYTITVSQGEAGRMIMRAINNYCRASSERHSSGQALFKKQFTMPPIPRL